MTGLWPKAVAWPRRWVWLSVNMIKLNFIPEQQRQQNGGIFTEDIAGVPAEIILGGIVALAGFLVAVHMVLAGVAVYRMAAYKMLEARWNGMSGDQKAYNEVSNQIKIIQGKLGGVRAITSAQGLHWALFLNELSDSIPKGVWLREIVFDRKDLAIYGSSVSRMKNEMVEAGNFVTALKEKRSIKDAFVGVDVDSIQRRENIAVQVADFSLKARRK